jgi:hypothetical protein
MANKIDTAIAAMVTKLAELVTAGTLKAVEQQLHDPMTENRYPLVGILFDGASRSGGSAAPLWKVDCILRILHRTKAGAGSQSLTDLIAAVQAKLDALSDSTSFGAGIELGRWQAGHHFQVANVPIAASMAMRLTFEGAL